MGPCCYDKADYRQGHDAWWDHKLCTISAAAGWGKCNRTSIGKFCQDLSSATTEPVCPCLLWIFQFLSMKLSAISPELNRDLDLRDVRLQFEKSNCGAKNAFQFTVPIAHIDLPFINACHCRSFAHKMLMLHFRDTVHNLAACILTCSGHLNKVSRIHNHTEWSQIHQMFMWQDRFSSYFSYLHFHRFVLDAPEQQQQVSKCLATTNGN